MPLYEYVCMDCKHRFDALRNMKDADAPISCQKCQSKHTSRLLSLFFTQSSGRANTVNASSGCSGCSGGSCSSCGR